MEPKLLEIYFSVGTNPTKNNFPVDNPIGNFKYPVKLALLVFSCQVTDKNNFLVGFLNFPVGFFTHRKIMV